MLSAMGSRFACVWLTSCDTTWRDTTVFNISSVEVVEVVRFFSAKLEFSVLMLKPVSLIANC